MTSKEVKVYLSKQIMMCEEKIELYENVKASKDFIELHKNLLDFYKTIEKDLEVLEIIKKRQIDIKDIIDTTDDYELYRAYCIGKGYADEYICNEEEFKKLKEWEKANGI